MKNIFERFLFLSSSLCFVLIGLNSCDQEEPIPSYIYIDKIQLQTENNEGTARHEITDAWVSVGNQLIGGFPLPATIPVLESGVQEVTVFPGIIQNGIGSTRDIYPFYTRYIVNTTLEPMVTDTINPLVKYENNANFALIEDFEASNLISDDIDGNNLTGVTITADEVYEGNRSGKITLTTTDNLIEVGSNLYYNIGERVSNVYVEFHYKNDVDFEVGITGRSPFTFDRFYKAGVVPSDDWRKVYVDLTGDISSMLLDGADEFQLVFRAINTTDETAYIYIDNIKLIYK